MKLQPRNIYTIIAVLVVGFPCAIVLLNKGNTNIPNSAQSFFPISQKKILNSGENKESLAESPLLKLEPIPLKAALPDLRSSLLFYGSNHRPDTTTDKALLFFSLRGLSSYEGFSAGEKVYLTYESKKGPSKWTFSKNNSQTPIWFIPREKVGEAEIEVGMVDSNGNELIEPQDLKRFKLPELHIPTPQKLALEWTIGSEKVDMTLLHRQKAIWYGQDLFLQELGGEEFEHALGRERIQFTHNNKQYQCYVSLNDCLVFSDDSWQCIQPGPETRGKPLMKVKKIEENRILFDLWDEEGKNKIVLDLHKTPSQKPSEEKLKIKLVGAKTRKTWIAEIVGTRTQINDDDWLLFQGDSFHKIYDPSQIDGYISGSLRGELLVLEGAQRINNVPSLVGLLFNEMRTEKVVITIPLFKSWEKEQTASNSKTSAGPLEQEEEIVDEDEDNDEDYEDNDIDDMLPPHQGAKGKDPYNRDQPSTIQGKMRTHGREY